MNQDGKKVTRRRSPEEQERTGEVRGTSRQDEEAFLKQTLAVIRDNLENYGGQVTTLRAEIDEMLDHFHDDNPELINLLENTMTLHDQMARVVERNRKAQDKPYFGRIDFYDETVGKEESLYIGKGGISKDSTHQAVIDWRAPVANAYYENGLGKCSYTAPGDRTVNIDLKLKRTYEIEKGKLLDYFDSEVVANDDLLTKYLAKNKQAVLGEIVATIQKEQNEIIRKSPYHNIIVQGVAGSGKTTVAMHRISFILYNYQERFRPDDFYIVGSNRILLNYITGVLPDLDVYGVRQMTMEELFVRLLYEDWDEKKYCIRKSSQSSNRDSIKGSLKWFEDLKAYCDRLEWKSILRDSVYLNPKQYVEGLRDGKSGVYDETVGKRVDPSDLVLLMDGEAVERYILQNPKVSMQNKINMLNDRLTNRIKEEFLGKGVKYTEAERKAILRAYRGRYGGKVWKGSIYEVYRSFLETQALKGKAVDIPGCEFDVYDLAALAYIYKRIKETEVISEAHHIVIDEAQDFGMMAYSVLHFCIRSCTYTVMGDVSQNIHFGFGLNDWEELKSLLLADNADSFGVLKKSYRNTVEISDFATAILHHGRFSSYPVEPIIRHGDPVAVRQAGKEDMIREAADICKRWQKKGFETIAIVCRTGREAEETAEALGKYLEVMENDLEKAVFGNGVMVLPVEYTKGLEFDTVLILDPSREAYPVDDGHAKLLYVAATRALHELCVLHTGNLTGLIADPIPERKRDPLSEKREAQSQPAQESGQEEKVSAGRKGAPVQCRDAGPNGADRKKAVAVLPARPSAQSPSPLTGLYSARPKAKIPRPAAETSPGSSSDPVRNAAEPSNAAKSSGNAMAYNIRRPASRTDAGNPDSAADFSVSTGSRTTGSGTNAAHPAANPATGAGAQPMASRSNAAYSPGKVSVLPAFGDIPATEKLRPAGHSKIDLSVRWISKQPDGLYLQSRYGILRLSPVGSAIIRVSFVKSGQPDRSVHPGIAVDRTEKFWMYKDNGGTVELTTDELLLRVDKASGAVRYLSVDEESLKGGKLLLAERSRECRQMENGSGGIQKAWTFFDWAKDEHLYSFGGKGQLALSLRGAARYISRCGEDSGLPFLFSDKGYGLLLATDAPVFCCDIPAYGSYLCGEYGKQLDFYFIAGKRQETIQNACLYLTGKL